MKISKQLIDKIHNILCCTKYSYSNVINKDDIIDFIVYFNITDDNINTLNILTLLDEWLNK